LEYPKENQVIQSAWMTFLKVQAASILGSGIDFLLTYVLVECFHAWYLMGNFVGNIVGGSTQFLLCRNWAFRMPPGKIGVQALKFILVFVGNLILSASLVYGLTHFLGLHYMLSKLMSSILLGVSYNYFLQKYLVFV
jgi:putative flippase GtrA